MKDSQEGTELTESNSGWTQEIPQENEVVVWSDSGIAISGVENEAVEVKVRNYPTKHNKHSLTDKQQVFAEELAKWKSGTDAVIAAYWEDVTYPAQFAYALRSKPQIQKYLMEHCGELLDIQMEMITNKKTPAAVRNDAIKFRLNAAWIWKEDDDPNDKSFSIGDIHINVVQPS